MGKRDAQQERGMSMHKGMTKDQMINSHNKRVEELAAANARQYQIIQQMKFKHEQETLDLRSLNKELVEGLSECVEELDFRGNKDNSCCESVDTSSFKSLLAKAKDQS